MQAREGDPLKLFLAFMEPFAAMEWTKPTGSEPEGGEESLFIGSRIAASVFAGGMAISADRDSDDANRPKVMLAPAA